MARIGAKLCQNAFRMIPDVSFFDAEDFFGEKFRIENFGMVWHVPQPSGPQNQLPRQMLLSIHLSRGVYVQKISDLVSTPPPRTEPWSRIPLTTTDFTKADFGLARRGLGLPGRTYNRLLVMLTRLNAYWQC